MTRRVLIAGMVFAATLAPQSALAAALDGRAMTWPWMLPFAGLLLSIAAGPLLFSALWEHHYGKIAAFWAACVIAALYVVFDAASATDALLATVLHEYVPFILLLLALFTVAGGIFVDGNLRGTPATNTALLAIGTVAASFVGTTGASMILIRPVLRANDDRRHKVHVVVFFIFLVSNIGGALTPLGDPPLFVGFLKGVDFFWTAKFLALPTLTAAAILLAVFFALDTVLHRHEGGHLKKDPTPDKPLTIQAGPNFVLLAVIIAAILVSAYWRPGVTLRFWTVDLELQNLARDLIFVAVTAASVALTPKSCRDGNRFEWAPIVEVAKLFAAIFICLVPVIAMLQAGKQGAMAPLVALVSGADGTPNNVAYFWLTGALSSFLDNAPTYLVFFELAGGDPATLMTTLARTLAAISAGAVFMGANSYIGNAPNFMVYAIARRGGVAMPSFFGYLLWSGGILVPLFVLLTFLSFS